LKFIIQRSFQVTMPNGGVSIIKWRLCTASFLRRLFHIGHCYKECRHGLFNLVINWGSYLHAIFNKPIPCCVYMFKMYLVCHHALFLVEYLALNACSAFQHSGHQKREYDEPTDRHHGSHYVIDEGWKFIVTLSGRWIKSLLKWHGGTWFSSSWSLSRMTIRHSWASCCSPSLKSGATLRIASCYEQGIEWTQAVEQVELIIVDGISNILINAMFCTLICMNQL